VSVQLDPVDAAHLDWARRIARRGWGRVHPNPMVGCILVRDGRVVGEGWHRDFGGLHAEIVALEEALTQAEGATAYVSLEPCDHHGKTPPCTEALVRAGVRRVVFGVADPGAGAGGARTLRDAGVEVVGPVWDERVGRAENAAFFHTARAESPFVALKLAMTLDARIAESEGVRTRITGPEAEREVHRLRSGFDAIMVGEGTVRSDDPRLTVRLAPEGRAAPRRLVLLPGAELPPDAAILEHADAAPVHAFVGEDAREASIEALEALGAHVHPVRAERDGLDLRAVLSVAWELGIRSVLCEGGARLAATLLRARLVQRLYLFVAPHTLGADALAAFPPDAGDLDWSDMEPAFAAEPHGRDTLIVLDRAPEGAR
jgi:diaminohydroxyphosphoribosylaminopyrimidine deaminase/5-amino-6-(5-phosphoribosylamino)uracil reductase